ncbi:MAG: MATE family efflux transporter [Alphaproteobacteria bacterium]|nr:MATE family efflux transporter [Alphaproteobacteria bacterium]
MIQDMTKGNPLKLILLFSLPILIGNIFQQLYHLADIFIVGRLLGENALAAVGASAPIFFTFLIIAFSFTGGLTAITAQRFGAKDYDGVRRSVTHSIRASLILGIGLTFILLITLTPLLKILNIPQSIFKDSYNFILILGFALILIIFSNLLFGFIRALGDSRTPLYFLIFTTIMNIIFNLIFIKQLKLGVIGSALGTVLAIFISVICCLIYIKIYYPILYIKKQDWTYNKDFMKEHLNIAIPMSIQFSILSLSIMIIQAVCNSFGEKIIVGFTIALRIEQLATQPLLAIGLAMATFVAQNYGAGRLRRIKKGVKQALATSFLISIVMSFCILIFGSKLIGLFLENPDSFTINIGASYLRISILFYFFLGAIFIFRNTLQSLGKPKYPVISCFIDLGIRSFSAIILASHIGYEGIYYASPLAWLGGSIVVMYGYYKNVYKRKLKDIKEEYHQIYQKMQP